MAAQTGRGSTVCVCVCVCVCVSSEGGCHSVGMHSNELQAPRVWQWLPRHLASRWHTLTHSRYGRRYTHCSAANINFLECSSGEQHTEEDKERCHFSFAPYDKQLYRKLHLVCYVSSGDGSALWHCGDKIWKMQSSEGSSLTL